MVRVSLLSNETLSKTHLTSENKKPNKPRVTGTTMRTAQEADEDEGSLDSDGAMEVMATNDGTTWMRSFLA